MTKDKSLIQSCIDHINTAIDVDPWAKEMVIEWGKRELEQLNNSNDCISRQALISTILGMTTFGNVHELNEFVHKHHLDGERMGGLRDAVFVVVNAPSVQPERKTGKWIDGYKRQTCSVCRQRGYRSWNFCPNCGANMRGEQE